MPSLIASGDTCLAAAKPIRATTPGRPTTAGSSDAHPPEQTCKLLLMPTSSDGGASRSINSSSLTFPKSITCLDVVAPERQLPSSCLAEAPMQIVATAAGDGTLQLLAAQPDGSMKLVAEVRCASIMAVMLWHRVAVMLLTMMIVMCQQEVQLKRMCAFLAHCQAPCCLYVECVCTSTHREGERDLRATGRKQRVTLYVPARALAGAATSRSCSEDEC